MIQSKYIQDEINRQKYGLAYALKVIKEDCTCQKCRTKYTNSHDARSCCK